MSGRYFLLKELVRRDLQSRYVGSVLGFFWSFAQPLFQLVLFTVVFSVFLAFRLKGEVTESFGIFLFAGLLPWMAVQEGVSRGATAIVDNAAIVKKAKLPLEVLVLSPTVSALVHQAIAGALFVVILALTGDLAPQGAALLFLALPLQLALTVGLGFLLSSAHTFFRDTAQVLNMFMMGWFYFTPIVYPLSMVGGRARIALDWNPLTPLVALYRQALLGGELVWIPGTWRLAVISLAVLLLGSWVFWRNKRLFVDEV